MSVENWGLVALWVVGLVAVWVAPILVLEARAEERGYSKLGQFMISSFGLFSWPGVALGLWVLRRRGRTHQAGQR